MSKISPFSSNLLIKDNIEHPFKLDYTKQFENFAKNLTAFIEGKSKDRPLVISLSAPWGMGKSTFVDMWGQWLLNNKKLAIKYDAWKNDFNENPLISILSAIDEQLFSWLRVSKDRIDKIKRLSSIIAKISFPVLFKFLTAIALDYLKLSDSLKQIEEHIREIGNEVPDRISSYVEKELEEHKKKSDVIDEFKDEFKKILSDKNKTLFFLIDELDRCKPIFSIAVLEIIKHFFDIERVCFVLVSNNESLLKTIKHVYGHDFDSQGYFERFIDRYFSLPVPDNSKYINYRINALLIENLDNQINYDRKTFKGCILSAYLFNKNSSGIFLKLVVESVCGFFPFNLREIQKYLDELSDILVFDCKGNLEEDNGIYENSERIPNLYLPVLSYLIALKRKDKLKYEKFTEKKTQLKMEEIELKMPEFEKEKFLWMVNLFLASDDKLKLKSRLDAMGERVTDFSKKSRGPNKSEEHEIIRKECFEFCDFFDEFKELYGYTEAKNQGSTIARYENHFELIVDKINFLRFMQSDSSSVGAVARV